MGTRAHDRLLSSVNKRVLEHRMSLVRFQLMYGCVIMELAISYFSERRLYLLTTFSSLLLLSPEVWWFYSRGKSASSEETATEYKLSSDPLISSFFSLPWSCCLQIPRATSQVLTTLSLLVQIFFLLLKVPQIYL